MNSITKWENARWNPFREMEDLNKLFSLLGRTPTRTQGDGEENLTLSQWMPLVDITEDDKEYVIKAELPEIRKEDLKIRVDDGVLTISGERKFEKEESGKKYHRVERDYGSFIRSFAVPDDAESSKVNAEFKEGVLRVRLAKNEKAKPKSIEVKVS